MATKENEGTAEKLLREFGQKIDELIAKGKESTADFRNDIDSTTEELKKTRDRVEAEIQKLKNDNKDAFDEIREGLTRAGSGVRKTFKSLLKKKKKKKTKNKKKSPKGSGSEKKTD